MAIRARPYETDADLRRMQALQQELWQLEAPRVPTHVGDLAWWLHRDLWKRQLWLDGDRCVAWGWLHRPAALDYEVHRAHRGGALHREVLEWFQSEVEGTEPLDTYALEGDGESLSMLAACGYERPEPYTSYACYVQDVEAGPREPAVPNGFTLHTVAGEDDFRKRVEIHRAVWAPSRVTEEVYRHVTHAWPYRPDLDCVLEAPDGSFAAYVLCWYDDANRVGELEPVGTHPDYRRQGLGAAVTLYALQRLREEGARQAVVWAGGSEDDKGPRALYESVGFRRHTRAVQFRKQRS